MTDNTFIYILKLEHDKYYIGRTQTPLIRLKKHYNGNGSAWTKKYAPQETLEVIPGCDHFDEDKLTKQYMSKYGIDNVRGGSYCQLTLSNEQKDFIRREISNVKDVCYKCGQSGHFISRCPQKNTVSPNKKFTDNFTNDFNNNFSNKLRNKIIIVESDASKLNNEYIIDDSESGTESESDSSSESGTESDSYSESGTESDSEYQDNLMDLEVEYDELINKANDDKCILNLFKFDNFTFAHGIELAMITSTAYWCYLIINMDMSNQD